MKAKGLKGTIVTSLSFQDYHAVLNVGPLQHQSYFAIRSIKTQLYTVKAVNVSISVFDDKRSICSSGIHTKGFGHYSIKRKHENEGCDY